ncbi:hypothetical protein OAQ99_03635 [Candidatus Kapabacteria bacterium]|nr:hypothetical protein [Candidatus Kapabacteria bacterium]
MKNLIFILIILLSKVDAQILDQSTNQSICLDSELFLYIKATGESNIYKWFKDGIEISESSNPAFSINNAKFMDKGVYQCRVESQQNNLISKFWSEPIVVDINQSTQIIDIKRSFRVDGDEQIWNFWADVHDDDLSDNTFRWEFDQSIGDINQVEGFSGINSNLLTVRFKYKENNFDYVRKLRFIADADCGADTAYTEVEQINFQITNLNSDTTICENEVAYQDYKIDYTLPLSIESIKAEVILNNEDKEIEKKEILLQQNTNSKNISFDYIIDESSIGNTFAKLQINQLDISSISDANRISYYPEIIINDRSTNPFIIDAGQPLKLRIWAEGSISNYVWIKGEADTLKNNDDPYYEVLSTSPNDAGDYKCILKSQCGDKIVYFDVIINKNEIENVLSISIDELQNNSRLKDAIFYSPTGQVIEPKNVNKGLYFIDLEGRYLTIFLN